MAETTAAAVPETIPETMAAAGFDEPGGPDVLAVRQVPVPRAGPNEVLIEVSHAGVNRPDVLQRQGAYPPPPGASPLPGLEVSGRIVALGQGVSESLRGQTVCALVPGGGYAEYCTVPTGHCLPVPDTLTLAEAAALPETLFTVWHNVFQRGQAKEGETLLIHGGTSGIGTMATMLGKLLGLTVIVTCGTEEKCEAARRIGADHAINYKAADFVTEVERITDGAGVELVLDMVAGDYTARNIQCLKLDGRLVTIAVLGGAKATVNMAQVMVKRLTLTGSTLRPRSDAFKAALAQDIADKVWPFVEQGRLLPVMDRTYALRDAAAAHRWMEAGEHIGKIVLEVRG
ncbi:NAD(P)H-quinone oxidoreductase [Altericroceibacterium xinjiangense]|uniref:NAD(P)H-quinone oxidoreductase n=1 Tax=Altericroceibacterium xinjiangense TaxID=762261 RepID=UPI001F49A404|nr:NAD(P)H-quinone oxidoreductase [Altericroceibacterium xinjiangense]